MQSFPVNHVVASCPPELLPLKWCELEVICPEGTSPEEMIDVITYTLLVVNGGFNLVLTNTAYGNSNHHEYMITFHEYVITADDIARLLYSADITILFLHGKAHNPEIPANWSN